VVQDVEGLGAVTGGEHVHPIRLEPEADHLDDRRVVVDDQHVEVRFHDVLQRKRARPVR